MPVVHHTLTRPGGVPMADEIIHIRLLAAASGEAEGFVAGSQAGILSEYKVRTDAAGKWSVTLTANALIVPANTVYQVIQPGITGSKVTETFIVPNAAGPFWLGDILAAAPVGLPQYGLDVHAAAPDPHTGYRLESVPIRAADVAADVATQAELDAEAAARAAAIVAHNTAADGVHTGTFVRPPNLGLFIVDSYAGNDDAKFAAALAAWHASPGGIIAFANRTYTFNDRWVITVDAGVLHGGTLPTQKPLVLQGAVASSNAWWDPPLDGTIINHLYQGPVSKLWASGTGYFEMCNLNWTDTSGGNTPFCLVTNTQPNIHDNFFCGTKTTTACDQDAIICGGTGLTRTGLETDAFAGYGGVIERNTFARIRECIIGRAGFNSIPIRDNMIGANCGSSDPAKAAIRLTGGASYLATGNPIEDNTIELTGYDVGIIIGPNSTANRIIGNGFYDAANNWPACVKFIGAGQNVLSTSVYDPANVTHYVEDAAAAGLNDIETTQVGAGQVSVRARRQRFQMGAEAPAASVGGAFAAVEPKGTRGYLMVANNATNPPPVQLWAAPPSAVADAVTTNGFYVVTSATANFAVTDIGVRAEGANVSGFIARTYAPATAPPWRANRPSQAGDIIRPTVANGRLYMATVAGTNGAAQPTFPTDGSTVVDGTTTWRDMGVVTAAVLDRPATATQAGLLFYFGRSGAAAAASPNFRSGHIETIGTIGAGQVAASAGLAGGSAAVAGNDVAGTLTLVSGGSPVSGPVQLCTVNFTVTHTGTPRGQLTPTNDAAGSLAVTGVVLNKSASSFQVRSIGTVPASTTFTFDYLFLS